ncbi:MAG: triose-phosphate isomerase [Bacteroidia bacterium]|nr:triose-phosphate isomerase [Bacteroidia bacterium]
MKEIIGNWKMNFTLQDVHVYFAELNEKFGFSSPEFDFSLAVPYPFIFPVIDFLDTLDLKNHIKVGAQDCSSFTHPGAYTGEVSAEMIASCGADFVIIGHSERRKLLNENSIILKKKIELAIKATLDIIYCVGETREERSKGLAFQIIEQQLTEVLKGLHFGQSNLMIAYEPVWAIGTGESASPEQANEMHAFIRSILTNIQLDHDNTKIIYGGSFNAKNASDLLSQPNIDGALIGTASLKPDEMFEILKIASAL